MDEKMDILSLSSLGKFLTWLSTLASIIGGVYSILVYYRMKKVEDKYLVKIRLPELISKLKEQNKDLPKLLSEFENDIEDNKKRSAVSSSIHSIKVILEDIKRKLDLDKSKSKHSSPPISKWLLSFTDDSLARMLSRRHTDIQALWKIQSDLSSVIMHLEQFNLDLGWART
jgi:hypothetical protein